MNEKANQGLLLRLAGGSAGLAIALLAGVGIGYLLFGGAEAGPVGSPEGLATGGGENAGTIWTCSMHPEVRLPRPGLCPKCHMALIPVRPAEGELTSLRELTTTEAAKALMDVETTAVERRFPTAEVRMVGMVDYDETRLAHITAWVPGRLDKLYVDYTGVPVRKGDHMVYLYSPELLSAQEELLQALEASRKLEGSTLGVVRETTLATVAAAREKLRLLGLTTDQVSELEKTGKASDHVTIYAPIGGIVIRKDAVEGMYVTTGMQIYALADLSGVWVKLDAYESDLMWLRYGQSVEFSTVGYPGETFTGTVSFIDPVLDAATRTVKVRVEAANADGRLKPGMFVKAVVRAQVAAGGRVMEPRLAGKWICPMHPSVIREAAGACDICGMPLVRTESLGYVSVDPAKVEKPLVIPVSAALVTGTRAVVYVKVPGKDKPTYEGREIVLGPRAGDFYLVRSGLAEGERVVTRGNFKIDSSLQILARPSMMNPEGGAGSAGHHHGGKEKPPVDGSPGAMLSGETARRFQDVLSRADAAVKAAAGEDLGAAREAFAALGRAVGAVQAGDLKGHEALVWKEMAMRLGNDAVEGREAGTVEEVRRVARSAADNAAALREKFGLPQPGGGIYPRRASP